MRFRGTLAVLVVIGLTAAPAHAETPATIAHAQRTDGWQLVLTDGSVVDLPEALTVAPKNALSEGADTPLLISGDGRYTFYYRKKDGLFVRRAVHGTEKVVTKHISVDSIGEQWPFISYDGDYVVTGTSAPGLGAFVDLRTGRKPPPPEKTDAWSFHGFSPDSERLALSRETDGPVVVFDRGLRSRLRAKTRLYPVALAGDYRTAVALVGKSDKYRKLRLLDLRTGRAIGGVVNVRLPGGQYIDDVDFARDGRLVVRSRTATGVAVHEVSPKTGAVTLLREIERPDVPVWVLPDDTEYAPWAKRPRK
ncbi:hypothetical protein [Nonomuraea longicatena]